jgi:prepilin-type N-terminal cleavage/methylation domain-containing protein
LLTRGGPPAGTHDRVLVRNRLAPAFTLIEVLVVMALLTILLIAGFSGIYSMDLCSRRLGDYTTVISVVESKIQDIKAASYNPPNYPFGSTIYLTNTDAIALDRAGATFKVPGTVISKIEPVAGGHLVTVTATFSEPQRPLTVTLETIVNKYSGGQR